MAYKWTCPHCGRSEYSASPHREKKTIKCIYCTKEYKNPHCEKREVNNGKAQR